MRELFVSVFSVSLVLGVLGLIFGRSGDFARRFAFSVLLSLAVITPLVRAVGNFNFDFDFEGAGIPGDDALYAEVAEDAFADGIASEISARFGIPRDAISVRLVDFDFSAMRASRIKITLFGRGIVADVRAIKEYLENKNIGECDVKIEL